MRCYICDYDEKLGQSAYLDTSGYLSDGLTSKPGFKAGMKTGDHVKGGGVVREDRDGKYVCSACRGASNQAVMELEFLDYGKEEGYINSQEEEDDDRDKAA